MKESVQPTETTGAQKKTNGLYVASVNRRMIFEDAINSMGEQYSCRNVDTPDYYSQAETSYDDNWMPAVLTPEEEKALYNEYY